MGCASDLIFEITRDQNAPLFVKRGGQKDGLDVYYYTSYDYIFFQPNIFYCPLCKDKFTENEVKEIKSLKRKDVNDFRFVTYVSSNIEEKLKKFDKLIKEEENYLKTLIYKYKCIKTNKEIYLKLYTGSGCTFEKYICSDRNISLCLDDLYYKNSIENRNNNEGKITQDGYFKGKKLCGKVQVLDSFADFKVQVVDSFPDLKVQKVDSFPDEIGKWQFVDSFPDFTIQFVDSFPDFKIQYVDSFPGVY